MLRTKFRSSSVLRLLKSPTNITTPPRQLLPVSSLSSASIPLSTLRVTNVSSCRSMTTAPSASGFHNYEQERANFRLDKPEYFNFAQDVIDSWAANSERGSSGNPAFWWVHEDGREIKWSFQQLSDNSKRVANMLSGPCGVRSGDRVLVVLPRLPEWWLINLACIRIGAVLIPGTTLLTSGDLQYRLQTSAVSCVIGDENIAQKVDQVVKECPLVKTKLVVGDSHNRAEWLSFNDLYETASPEHNCLKTRSDEPMTIFFTSGTTGPPKMTEHTHASYGIAHIITGKYWLDLTPDDIHWNLSDTGWAKSAWSNLFAPWIQGACVFIYQTKAFDPVQSLQALEKYPVSTFCTAPTAYRMFILENLTKYNFGSVRHFVSAGEPLNPEVIEHWQTETGQLIREGYGQTETVLQCGQFRCLPHRMGSMGKPSPGYNIKIVDDHGLEVPVGTEGDLAIETKPERPVGLFTRYVNEPDRTAEAFRGDVYVTGDRAFQDEDGYLYFVGRADDVITSSGYRIGPFEVESALLEHEAVVESAVVSSPDPTRGEVVKAFVVLTEEYDNAKDDEDLVSELQQHVKTTTAAYKYPRKIEFVKSLPKTVSGKIRRVELRNKEWGKNEKS